MPTEPLPAPPARPASALPTSLPRRSLLRGSLGLLALAGFGRALEACDDGSTGLGTRAPRTSDDTLPTPTDGDEYVPGENAGPPVDANDLPPTIPNQTWEARAKQLEDEQRRLGHEVFSKTAPGPWAGKERSHVPVATAERVNGVTKVVVLVEHVMGKNALDAGYTEASAPEAAAADASADAADAARPDAAADGGDAGRLDASADASAPTDAGPPPPEHYITTIYVRATVDGLERVVGLWEFASTDAAPPSVRFTMPAGVTSVVAYEYCTLHGLWKADPITL